MGLQYALRQYRKAKRQYEIALKLDDSHALGHCNYATILMQMVDRKYNKYYNEEMDRFDDPSGDEEEAQSDPYFDDEDGGIGPDGGNGAAAIPKGEYDEFILDGGYKVNAGKSGNGGNDNLGPKRVHKDDHKESAEEEGDRGLDGSRLSVYSKRYSSKKEEYFTKSEWHFKKSVALNRSL